MSSRVASGQLGATAIRNVGFESASSRIRSEQRSLKQYRKNTGAEFQRWPSVRDPDLRPPVNRLYSHNKIPTHFPAARARVSTFARATCASWRRRGGPSRRRRPATAYICMLPHCRHADQHRPTATATRMRLERANFPRDDRHTFHPLGSLSPSLPRPPVHFRNSQPSCQPPSNSTLKSSPLLSPSPSVRPIRPAPCLAWLFLLLPRKPFCI